MSTGTPYTRNPPILGNETMWASFCLSKFRALAIVRRHTHNRKTRNRSQIKHRKGSPKENGASLKMTGKDAQRDWIVTHRPSETGATAWSGPDYQTVSKDTKVFFYKKGRLWLAHISEHKWQPQLLLGKEAPQAIKLTEERPSYVTSSCGKPATLPSTGHAAEGNWHTCRW